MEDEPWAWFDAILKRESGIEQITEIPVLCRFWDEDGVCNGEAVDLPVAVFGANFEEAKKHLGEAVISHLETLQEIGTLENTILTLRAKARKDKVCIQDMSPNQSLVKMSAGLQDHRLVCIA